MKTFTCHLLIMAVVALSFSRETEAADAAATPVVPPNAAEDCIAEGDVSGVDTLRIMTDEVFSPKYKETSEKLKCFLLCFYKKVGIINADGKHKPEMVVKYLEYRHPEKKDKFKPAVAKCSNIKSSNPCEAVYMLEGCVLKNVM